jgi:nucleolar protein 14
MIAANLFNLSQQMPDTAGVLFREYLITLRKKLISCNGERKFPDLKVLLFLRMIPHIFPASDLRHNVVSPLETLLGNFLANGIMRNSKDAITGISTALLSLHICREKARFSPEG